MPELLNFLYEQLSYHKILPFVYDLSMKISRSSRTLVDRVPTLGEEEFVESHPQMNARPIPPFTVCDNFREKNCKPCPITKSFAQN